MGILQALFCGAANPYVNPLPGGTANGQTAFPAVLVVKTNGTMDLYATYPTPTVQSWYSPTTTGIGTGHYVRFVKLSGDALNVGSETYTELSSDRTGGFNQLISQSATVRVDIASDADGASVVCSGTYTFTMVA